MAEMKDQKLASAEAEDTIVNLIGNTKEVKTSIFR